LRGRLEALRAAAAKQGVRPTVVCLEWFEPLMVAGNWVPELVEIAGGRDVLGKAGEHSPWIEWEAVRRADPDVIVLMPCGFDHARTVTESARLRTLPGWSDLKAVRSGRVFAVDGNSYFNRPGPRLVESAEILAEVLWPDIISAREKRWQRLSETPGSSGRRSRVP
jgi:iron complex transport system substrate-binding protein